MSSKYITVDGTNATSLAEAKILAKQHEGLHWKVNRKSPGNSSQGTAIFQCNSHVNCPRLLRVACIQGVYYLQVRGGAQHRGQPICPLELVVYMYSLVI